MSADRPIRLLLLEDSKTDAEIILRELQRAGYAADSTRVENERDFVEALDRNPDLILADYSLPQFDGMRAVELLRGRGMDTPFILISGTLGEEIAVTAIKRGADDYLLKSNLVRLPSAVANALAMKQLRDHGRKSEALYRLISENAADVIWTFDIASMRITFVSPSVERLTGRRPAEVMSGTIEDFLTPASRDLVMGKLRDTLLAFAGGDRQALRVQTSEVQHVRRDGSTVDVEMVTTVLTRADGHPTTVLGVSRDISERRRAEAAARRSTERLRALYELGQRTFRSETELLAYAMTEKRHISGAPIAFFHFVDAGRITGSAWSTPQPDAAVREADLWSECIRTRELVIRNRPDAHVPAVRSFICVPVFDGANLVAVAGVANKETAFDDTDVLQLRLFMDQVWKLIVHHRSEDSLARSEEKYRQIVETANEGIWMIDADACTTYVNRRLAEMLGLDAGEMIGRPVTDFREVEDAEQASRGVERARSGITEIHEVRLRRRDGTTMWTLMSTSPLFDEGHVYIGALAMVTDISALKRAYEERQLLVTGIEQAAESIVITDASGTIRYVNPAFTKTTGYQLDDALGRNPRFLKSGKHPPDFYRVMWDTLLAGHVWSGRVINRRKNGTEYEEEMTISPVRDAAGRTVSYVAVKRDVTELTALEKQLHHAQKMEAIGTLAGGVAHDFNNLLQALISQIQVLRRRSDAPDKVNDVAAELEKQVKRGASLTRQLLMFARRETGKVERFDLTEAVRETLRMLRHLVRENVSFHIDPSREPLPLESDRGEIEQVLTNLVVNASDAMHEGGSLTVATAAGPAATARLTVGDTGPGIPDEIRDRIFEPFFTTKPAGHGTGLGLSVVHGIVTRQGGSIEVRSSSNGATFTITLPLAPARAEENIAAPTETAMVTGARERILLVEDEDGVRDGLREILTSLDFDVLAVASAEEAEVVSRNATPFAMLITDLTLPGKSGHALAAGLMSRWPSLRVIFMSGYPDNATLRNAVDGGIHVLQKPFDSSVLLREIRSLLASH